MHICPILCSFIIIFGEQTLSATSYLSDFASYLYHNLHNIKSTICCIFVRCCIISVPYFAQYKSTICCTFFQFCKENEKGAHRPACQTHCFLFCWVTSITFAEILLKHGKKIHTVCNGDEKIWGNMRKYKKTGENVRNLRKCKKIWETLREKRMRTEKDRKSASLCRPIVALYNVNEETNKSGKLSVFF